MNRLVAINAMQTLRSADSAVVQISAVECWDRTASRRLHRVHLHGHQMRPAKEHAALRTTLVSLHTSNIK